MKNYLRAGRSARVLVRVCAAARDFNLAAVKYSCYLGNFELRKSTLILEYEMECNDILIIRSDQGVFM